jgi:hypothetical protein
VTASPNTVTEDITLPASTITTTLTATPAPSPCNPAGEQPTFFLQVAADSPADGEYVSVSNLQINNSITLTFDTIQATSFTFDSACHLVDLTNGEIAGINQNSTSGETLYFNTPAYSDLNGYVAAVCYLVSGAELSCTVAGLTQFIVYCSDVGEIAWGNSLDFLEGEDPTCAQVGLVAVS